MDAQNNCWLQHYQNLSNFVKKVLYLGGMCGGEPPVPIPNTEANTASADDTWSASSWESRSPPRYSTFFFGKETFIALWVMKVFVFLIL
jgi:hypothetical protein